MVRVNDVVVLPTSRVDFHRNEMEKITTVDKNNIPTREVF